MLRKASVALGGLIMAFIVYATLCPIQGRPKTGHPDLERFAAFFLVGALLSIGLPNRRRILGVGIVIAACALEAAQLLIPTRDAHIHDALVKAVGGLAGVASAIWPDSSLQRSKP